MRRSVGAAKRVPGAAMMEAASGTPTSKRLRARTPAGQPPGFVIGLQA
jgi:hypothetical protein